MTLIIKQRKNMNKLYILLIVLLISAFTGLKTSNAASGGEMYECFHYRDGVRNPPNPYHIIGPGQPAVCPAYAPNKKHSDNDHLCEEIMENS